MIQTFCGCGATVAAEESAAVAACGGCGGAVRLATAEPLGAGMAAGDFDARLVVDQGPAGAGETIALGGVADLEIGKAEHRHVRLAGTRVSWAHAKLVRVDFGPSRWQVIDTGSTNGVFVNGERVAEAELADGDRVQVGEYLLRFVLAPPPAVVRPAGEVLCPACRAGYSADTQICVGCGIYIRTGRPLVTSRGLDEDALAVRADTWIRTLSWFVPFGLFPIASEAFGNHKPRAIWWITGITVAASLLFFVALLGGDGSARELMMWSGDGPHAFHAYQLLTSALLHGGLMHLAGNLVFLLVFGLRVNELIGNLKLAIVYPVLAVASGLTYLAAQSGATPHAYLGASGAIMGLAGMYVVFFPVQQVFMAVWLRVSPFLLISVLWRWRCWYKVFRMRGAWLLGLWVGLNDVLPTAVASPGRGDGVAHWAHLGGFATGAAIAVGLLVSRQANAHGSDLLSVTLGSRAWAVLGRPNGRATA